MMKSWGELGTPRSLQPAAALRYNNLPGLAGQFDWTNCTKCGQQDRLTLHELT